MLTISGLNNIGLDKLWETITAHRVRLTAAGVFHARRSDQAVRWMRGLLEQSLMSALLADSRIAARLPMLEADVRAGAATPQAAVAEVMTLFHA